jgi:cyclopropane-fatty-acyl-phospholipid synthase
VNISTEQVHYGREINKALPVEIYLCDYRDAQTYNPNKTKFDKVVSVGLCEHVGVKNYRHFLEIARANMKEDGLFLLHTIGKAYTDYFTDPWITKYIFPNGILPSMKLLSDSMEELFILEDFHNFGADYDKTLMAWHENFIKHWDELKGSYDEKFFRLWNYYLLSCAGAFRARTMQLWQLVLSPNGVIGGYESKR